MRSLPKYLPAALSFAKSRAAKRDIHKSRRAGFVSKYEVYAWAPSKSTGKHEWVLRWAGNDTSRYLRELWYVRHHFDSFRVTVRK